MMRALILFALTLGSPGLAADGGALYKRCAACHLPTGAGLPGAFPPLGADFRTLSAGSSGRRYLILAVIKGVAGPITVEGKPYGGVMPAQSALDDAAVASVLNHVAMNIAKAGKGFKSFTPSEVATARSGGVALNGSAVAKLHREVRRK